MEIERNGIFEEDLLSNGWSSCLFSEGEVKLDDYFLTLQHFLSKPWGLSSCNTLYTGILSTKPSLFKGFSGEKLPSPDETSASLWSFSLWGNPASVFEVDPMEIHPSLKNSDLEVYDIRLNHFEFFVQHTACCCGKRRENIVGCFPKAICNAINEYVSSFNGRRDDEALSQLMSYIASEMAEESEYLIGELH